MSITRVDFLDNLDQCEQPRFVLLYTRRVLKVPDRRQQILRRANEHHESDRRRRETAAGNAGRRERVEGRTVERDAGKTERRRRRKRVCGWGLETDGDANHGH